MLGEIFKKVNQNYLIISFVEVNREIVAFLKIVSLHGLAVQFGINNHQ